MTMNPKVKANSDNNLKYDNLIKSDSDELQKALSEKCNKANEEMKESTQQPGQGKLEYFTE